MVSGGQLAGRAGMQELGLACRCRFGGQCRDHTGGKAVWLQATSKDGDERGLRSDP